MKLSHLKTAMLMAFAAFAFLAGPVAAPAYAQGPITEVVDPSVDCKPNTVWNSYTEECLPNCHSKASYDPVTSTCVDNFPECRITFPIAPGEQCEHGTCCEVVTCPAGQKFQGGECRPIQCGDNETLIGSRCVPVSPAVKCRAEGGRYWRGQCVSRDELLCKRMHWTHEWTGSSCERKQGVTCPNGYKEIRGRCYRLNGFGGRR